MSNTFDDAQLVKPSIFDDAKLTDDTEKEKEKDSGSFKVEAYGQTFEGLSSFPMPSPLGTNIPSEFITKEVLPKAAMSDVLTYDTKKDTYSVVSPTVITPFISAKEDPTIAAMLKDDKFKKFLEENWVGSTLRTKTGGLTGVVTFQDDISLDEKFKLFDQNDGRTLHFKDGTKQDIDFTAIANKYLYNKDEGVPPMAFPSAGFQIGPAAQELFAGKIKPTDPTKDVEYVDKNIQKFADHIRKTFPDIDEKKFAAFVKAEGQRSRFLEGMASTKNFIVQTGVFTLGELIPRVGSGIFIDPDLVIPTIEIEGINITTMDGRGDLLNKYAPSLARSFQRKMIAGGIDVTIEEAETVMGYSPTFTEKVKKFGGEAVPIAGPATILQAANRVAAGYAFKQFMQRKSYFSGVNPYTSFDKAADAFINEQLRNSGYISQLLNNTMPSIRKNMYEDRLAGFFEIEDLKLPINQKRAYKNQVKVIQSIDQRITGSKPKNMSQSDWINTPEYLDLTRQKRMALLELQATKLKGLVPKFVRENITAEGTVILFGASAGQIFQSFGFNQNSGEVLGILLGTGRAAAGGRASGVIPKDLAGITSLGLENAVNGTGKILLAAAESLYFGKGYLLRDSSVYKTLKKKQVEQVETIAAGFNQLAPEIREQVLQRVQVFFDSRTQLLNAGVPAEVLDTTLSKLTGLAVLELAEASISSSLSAGEALKSGVLSKFQEIASKKDDLNSAIAKAASELTASIPVGAGTDDVVSKFITQLNDGVKQLKDENDALKDSIAAVSNAMTEQYIKEIIPSGLAKKELSSALDTIYDIANVSVDTLKVGNSIENIRKTEKRITTEVYQEIVKLRATAKTPKDFENINHFLEIISENKRKSVKEQAQLNYDKIDKDFADLNIRADATSLFNKIMDYSLDTSKPAFAVGNLTISDSVANNLLKQFDNSAREVLDEFAAQSGDPDEFYDTIKTQMIGANFNRKDIRPSTMVHFLRTSENINLPIKLNFKEVQAIHSGLKKQYFAASQKNLPSTANYDTFATDAESLFNNFTLPDGTDIGEEVAKRQKEANDFYFSEYAAKYLRKNSLGVKWLGYSGKVPISDLAPSGKAWNTPVNQWIDIDKIASGQINAETLNGKLRIHFGKTGKTMMGGKQVSTSTLTNELGEGGEIGEIARYKTIQYIADKFEVKVKGKKPVSINDLYEDNSLKNIQTAFAGTGFDPFDLIGEHGYFGLAKSAERNKKLANVLEEVKVDGKRLINSELGPANFYQKEVEKNIRWFENNVQGVKTSEDFFNFAIKAPPSQLNDLKQVALLKGNMSSEQFDNTVKYVVAKHINDKVFFETPRKGYYGDNTKAAAQQYDTDVATLDELLMKDEQVKSNMKRILGDEHYNVLSAVSKFLSTQKGKQLDNTLLTGIPRGLSVESWISRVYAVNRNVISKRYVATEAAIQAARLNNFSILEEMIRNPEAAKLFGDIILSGKPLTDQQNARITQIIYTGIARLNQRTPESPFFRKAGEVASNVAGYIGEKAGGFASAIVDATF